MEFQAGLTYRGGVIDIDILATHKSTWQEFQSCVECALQSETGNKVINTVIPSSESSRDLQ